MRIPKMRKKNGQYHVRLNGRDHYLGHDKKAAETTYKSLLAAHLQADKLSIPQKEALRFSDILSMYVYHVRNAVSNKYLEDLSRNCSAFGAAISDKLARDIKPTDLATFRDVLAREQLATATISRKLTQVKQVMRYAVETGLIDITVYQALTIVENAKVAVHDGVKPSKKRMAVDVETALSVINSMRPLVRDLLLVQLYSGARPGEINRMRVDDLETSGDVWIYHLKTHKTVKKTNEEQLRYLGTRCQDVIKSRLESVVNGLIFANSNGNPLSTHKVSMELRRACKAAGVEPFCPYQLRHTAGTIGRKIAGLDGAQALLGHQSRNTTEIYAERTDERALKIAREFG